MTEKYTSKVRTIDALQLTPENADSIAEWCGGGIVVEKGLNGKDLVGVNIPTLQGVTRASEGDYVIRNASGTFQTMSRFAFESEFEPKNVSELHSDHSTIPIARIESHDPRERWRTI
jgi:hypothetical protein